MPGGVPDGVGGDGDGDDGVVLDCFEEGVVGDVGEGVDGVGV